MRRGLLLGITAAIIICLYKHIRKTDKEIQKFDLQMKVMKTQQNPHKREMNMI